MAHVTWALEIAGQKKNELSDDCVLSSVSVGVRACLLGSCVVGLPANKKGAQALPPAKTGTVYRVAAAGVGVSISHRSRPGCFLFLPPAFAWRHLA